MRAAALFLVLGGCAQLVGIDETTGPPAPVDARPVDAVDAPPIDARACAGGDARVSDPGTGSCFVLFRTPATRENARISCLGLGSDTQLARIESATENAAVTALVGQTIAYIGAVDVITEGAFVWQDGTPMTYANWNTAEPNNGAGMFEEDCAVINGTLAGRWDDRPCAPPPIDIGAAAYVCEHN